MVKTLLLDTNILIEELRQPKRETVWKTIQKEANRLIICPITLTELWAGESMARAEGKQTVGRLLRVVGVVSIKKETYQLAGTLLREYRDLFIADALIAASAMHEFLPLVTLNQKHFAAISGLMVFPLSSIASS